MKRLLILFLLFAGTANLFALDDRVLVLPPSYDEVDYSPEVWQDIVKLYQSSVLGKAPIPITEITRKWAGEIRVTDYQNPGDAFTYGQEFEADFVVMTQLHRGSDFVEMQLLNPWEGTILNIISGNSTADALFQLEKKVWIYGTVWLQEVPPFEEPGFVRGEKAVSYYMEENNTYPPEAKINMLEAHLEIEVLVSREGIPVSVKVLRNSQPNYPFDKAVEQALWAVKYIPAKTEEGAVNALLKKRLTVYPEP